MFMSETEVCRYRQKMTGKVHLRTGHEGSEGKYRYSSTLFYSFFNLGARWGEGWVRGSTSRPAALLPGKRPGTHCTGDLLGPRAGLDGCGKYRPHRDSIPAVQPAASRYTDWAIAAYPHHIYIYICKCFDLSFAPSAKCGVPTRKHHCGRLN
jgi:hypothetical protein